MEALKIVSLVYAVGVLIHFYFLPLERAVLWPMVILGLTVSVISAILNVFSTISYAFSITLKYYGYFIMSSTFYKKGEKHETSSSDNAA